MLILRTIVKILIEKNLVESVKKKILSSAKIEKKMIIKKEDNPIFVRLSVCYTIVEKNELKEKKKQKLSGRAFI